MSISISWPPSNFDIGDYQSSSDDEKEPTRKRKSKNQEVDGVKQKTAKQPKKTGQEKKISSSPEILQKIKQILLSSGPLMKVITKESEESPEVVREGRISLQHQTIALDDQVKENHTIDISKITSVQRSDRQILEDFDRNNWFNPLLNSKAPLPCFLQVQTKDNQIKFGQLIQVKRNFQNPRCIPATFTIRTAPTQDRKVSNEIQFKIDDFVSLNKLTREECKDIEFKRKNLFHSAVAEGTLMLKPLADIAAEYIREFPIEWETPPQQPAVTQPLDE